MTLDEPSRLDCEGSLDQFDDLLAVGEAFLEVQRDQRVLDFLLGGARGPFDGVLDLLDEGLGLGEGKENLSTPTRSTASPTTMGDLSSST